MQHAEVNRLHAVLLDDNVLRRGIVETEEMRTNRINSDQNVFNQVVAVHIRRRLIVLPV